MLMRVNIRYDICLQQAIVVNYFAQMLSFDRIQPFLQRFAYRSCAFGQVSVFFVSVCHKSVFCQNGCTD